MAGATDTDQPAGWQCCCGQQGNQGNFCAVCGRPRPAQALYQSAYPAESGNGNRKVKLALICVIVVLAAVLVFLVVRENTLGADADSSTYSVVSKQKKAAADKAAASATAKTASPSAPAAASARSELSLGGVDLGLTVDDMRRILGPEDSSKTQDGMILYNYPELQVGTRGGVVTSLVSETDQACTKRELHQGASLDEVKAAYGTDYMKSAYGGKDLYEYSFTAAAGQQGILRFAVNQGTDIVNYISIRIPD